MGRSGADEAVQTQKKQSEMLFVRGEPVLFMNRPRLALTMYRRLRCAHFTSTPIVTGHLNSRVIDPPLQKTADAERKSRMLSRYTDIVLVRELSKVLEHDCQKHHHPMFARGKRQSCGRQTKYTQACLPRWSQISWKI